MALRHLRLGLIAVIASALLLSSCATAKMPTANPEPIDLQRFMGEWHVIAHVPYFAEKGDVASVDEYRLKSPGKIEVTYHYQKGFGEQRKSVGSRATVKDGSGNRDWTTWFFGVIPTKYRIVEVAPDYSWAVIGYPGRDLAWVFGREPVMDDALYAELLEKAKSHGVDTSKLMRIPQVPEQVGKPGFAAPDKP